MSTRMSTGSGNSQRPAPLAPPLFPFPPDGYVDEMNLASDFGTRQPLGGNFLRFVSEFERVGLAKKRMWMARKGRVPLWLYGVMDDTAAAWFQGQKVTLNAMERTRVTALKRAVPMKRSGFKRRRSFGGRKSFRRGFRKTFRRFRPGVSQRRSGSFRSQRRR